ncbi:hypothetical protein BDQ17DRAFT_1371472 [Cyathus striatus]|nr:hypothetical protein BDQ17DRAFT_1371472 [Cyathus striatus]
MARDLIFDVPPRPTEPGDILMDIPTTTGDHLRLRLYRDEDSEEVRHLFLSCIVDGPDAPVARGIKDQLFRIVCFSNVLLIAYYLVAPSSLQAQVIASFGGVTYLPLAIWGLLSIGFMCLSAYSVKNAYYTHCNRGLQEELVDLGSHYYNPRARALGCKKWVIEDVGKSRVVGCVGFDNSSPSPLVRRMSVNPEYQGQGLGKLLIKTLIDHVEWYNHEVRTENVKGGKLVEEIVLTTTTYQPPAVHLYTKNGWVLQGYTKLVWWMIGLNLLTFSKKF